MRIIKFRAWEKENLFVNFEGAMHYDVVAQTYFGEWLFDNDYELMQYTGLKDKDGFEIYEGDIIKRLSYTKPFIVEFILGSFVLTGDTDTLDFIQTKKVEVIGNIYENKELLK